MFVKYLYFFDLFCFKFRIISIFVKTKKDKVMKSIVEKIENGEIKLGMLSAVFNQWDDVDYYNDYFAYELSYKMWYDEDECLIRDFAIELTAVYSSEGDEIFVTGKEKEAIEQAIVKRYDEFIYDYF